MIAHFQQSTFVMGKSQMNCTVFVKKTTQKPSYKSLFSVLSFETEICDKGALYEALRVKLIINATETLYLLR